MYAGVLVVASSDHQTARQRQLRARTSAQTGQFIQRCAVVPSTRNCHASSREILNSSVGVRVGQPTFLLRPRIQNAHMSPRTVSRPEGRQERGSPSQNSSELPRMRHLPYQSPTTDTQWPATLQVVYAWIRRHRIDFKRAPMRGLHRRGRRQRRFGACADGEV